MANADIGLDADELALWNEVGSRGDAFRRAIRDRADEKVRQGGKMIEIVDGDDQILDSRDTRDPDPDPPRSPGA